ncbi:MAG: hypothetical protein ABEJ81_04145 [Haloferacaceae archaeon]
MRIGEDDRARVPFALIGVLLLLGSTTFATTLAGRGLVREDRSADKAVQRVEANAAAAVRGSVRTAARDAAREPLTRPANTSFGRVIDPNSPFRDALRIRIYLIARRRLRAVRYRHGDVVARASLPATPTPAALRAAKARVRIEATDGGTALRVRLRGVNYTATRAGRRIVTRTRTVALTVATPVLALHDRTRRFERRLDRDPLDGPGLGRRLTARLYPVVWARAYAQREGLPVENVLANRHVAVATNGAVLAEQRAAFGRSDPDGRRGTRRALVRLGARDLAPPLGPGADAWTRRVIPRPNDVSDGPTSIPRFETADAPSPRRRFVVGVNRSADAAMGRVLAADGNRSFDGAIRAGYRVTGRLHTATRLVRSDPRPDPIEPDGSYSLDDRRVSATVTVRNATAPRPTVGDGERRVVTREREVTAHRRVTWVWADGNETERTHGEWSATYRIGFTVTVEPDGRAPGPNRTVRPAFRRGGPLDGPNLADVPARVRELLIGDRGGPDAVARRVALDRLGTRRVRVVGRRPDDLRRWVYADLAGLRDRIRNVSVRVRGDRLAAGRANPAADLAARIRAHRSAFVDAPETYRGAADRARVAARVAYVDAVLAALDRRAAARRARTDRLDRVLADAGAGSGAHVLRVLRASRSVADPRRRVPVRGPTGPVRPTPDASPAYLTLAAVDRERVDAVPAGERYHPLTAQNRNLFAVPYGDDADRVGGGPEAGTDLRTAGSALVAANQVPARRAGDRLDTRRDRLSHATSLALRPVLIEARNVVRRRTTLGGSTAVTVVHDALHRWNGTGRRALAATNGSLQRAIAAEAVERLRDPNATRADRLATWLRLSTGRVVRGPRARVDENLTASTRNAVRDLAGRALYEADASRRGDGTRRPPWTERALGGVPAGLPVSPVPGYWYATTNVWTVRVRGAYARFFLRTRRGVPGQSLRYVRDGSTVALDVTGDGEPERLGYDERISFETNTTVVVAVPPGGGVGDGEANERSSGWPRPACLGRGVARRACRWRGESGPPVGGRSARGAGRRVRARTAWEFVALARTPAGPASGDTRRWDNRVSDFPRRAAASGDGRLEPRVTARPAHPRSASSGRSFAARQAG